MNSIFILRIQLLKSILKRRIGYLIGFKAIDQRCPPHLSTILIRSFQAPLVTHDADDETNIQLN